MNNEITILIRDVIELVEIINDNLEHLYLLETSDLYNSKKNEIKKLYASSRC